MLSFLPKNIVEITKIFEDIFTEDILLCHISHSVEIVKKLLLPHCVFPPSYKSWKLSRYYWRKNETCALRNHRKVWKTEKFTLTWKIFCENSIHCDLVLNPLIARKFCKEVVRENFCNFHTEKILLHMPNCWKKRINYK